MDFKKIEIIFLTVFLSIDIFLFYTILQTPSLSTNTPTTQDTNVRTEMAADNISLPKLSNKKSFGYYLASQITDELGNKMDTLNNQRVSYDKSTKILSSRLNAPIRFDNVDSLVEEVNEFKENPTNIIHGSDYVYSKYLSTDSQLVYVQNTKYGRISDSTGLLTFVIRDKNIIGYTQGYQTVIRSVREKQETISPHQAVSYLYMYSELPNDSVIKWVKLGYTKMTQVKGNIIYLPAWTIGVENKNTNNLQIKRVNALNGAIIASSNTENSQRMEAS